MAALASALSDLATPAGRLTACRAITNTVYGISGASRQGGAAWRPRSYAENKGRYLWTDAFGVCNFLTLACESEGRDERQRYLECAKALVGDVHDTLGRTRDGRRRLGDATDEAPTLGGLRIGKPHSEGHLDGDGQYFHYLTKWAFALDRMSLACGDPKYHRWAVQMMAAVHHHFVVRGDGGAAPPCMVWKASIDLSRPLVPSEGNLDPFDGLVTCRLLQQTGGDTTVLQHEVADFESMVQSRFRRYSSSDPLDLGEACWLAHWVLPGGEDWAQLVSQRSLGALGELWDSGYFAAPRHHTSRLAFREFGATLGVQVNPLAGPQWGGRVARLHQAWAAHLFDRDADITPVMACASLVPGVWSREYTGRLQRLPQQMAG